MRVLFSLTTEHKSDGGDVRLGVQSPIEQSELAAPTGDVRQAINGNSEKILLTSRIRLVQT